MGGKDDPVLIIGIGCKENIVINDIGEVVNIICVLSDSTIRINDLDQVVVSIVLVRNRVSCRINH